MRKKTRIMMINNLKKIINLTKINKRAIKMIKIIKIIKKK